MTIDNGGDDGKYFSGGKAMFTIVSMESNNRIIAAYWNDEAGLPLTGKEMDILEEHFADYLQGEWDMCFR